MTEERLLVIVGKEKDSDATPFVIGALNDEYLNQMGIEDGDAEINKLKMTWAADPDAYHWREVIVVVQMDEIAKMFDTPVVHVVVEMEE